MNLGAGAWGTPVTGGPMAPAGAPTGTVTVDRATTVGNVGSGFLGFSYEKTHLMNGSLVGSNANMIALYKLIGPVVIRIGANDVERCHWVPGTPVTWPLPAQPYPIGTVMVDGLEAFLTASGAKVIYGINYSLNNPSNDAQEATYAFPKLGGGTPSSNIIGFEIGNELDKYGAWTGERGQWEGIAAAVHTAVPMANFVGMAATAGGYNSHNAPFAMEESQNTNINKQLVMLTQHYYIGQAGTFGIGSLQTIKADIPVITASLNNSATTNHIPMAYRFGEANTFWGHGQPGISDTLIAALWSLDLMFTIAQNGGTGINFHGGETGMDGTKPFTYTPIVEANAMVTGTQPIYDGMLAFYLMGQGPVLKTTVNTTNPNFTAYTVNYTADGSTMVVLDNKNATQGVLATVNIGAPATSASAVYLEGTPAGSLTAPAASVTLAGAGVTAQGTWARNPPFTQMTSGNTVTVWVPPVTAAIVRVH
jgi:hypothetical protein